MEEDDFLCSFPFSSPKALKVPRTQILYNYTLSLINCLQKKQVLIAGGRALLQVEDCPKESVEKLRGEVEDEYSLSPFSISSQAGSAIFSLFLRAGCKSNPGRPAVRPGQADLLLLPLEDQQLHRQLYRRHQHHYL